MGKASRRKKEYRKPTQLEALSRIPQKIYRFFKEAHHAEALVSGEVWLSTLEACRIYENPYQGDQEEAIHTYNSGHATGGSNDATFKLIAKRSSIHIGPNCSNITISNCTSIEKIPDAFILCTTEKFNPEALSETFGSFCVEINRPHEFFRLITMHLSKSYRLQKATCGLVTYQERGFSGLQNPPGHLGFVKPPDQYKNQCEFRGLWIPTSDMHTHLEPFLLEVPECAALCQRIK